MSILDLIQDSKEWLEFRKSKIGASDAPIIMGKSPFTTPLQLYISKTEKNSTQTINPSILIGKEKEEEARDYISRLKKRIYIPKVFQSDENPWQIASLDGIDCNGDIIEIKCPGEKTIRKAFQGNIPDYYKIQVQHQMCVCEASRVLLVIYNHCVPELPKHQEFLIFRDDQLIEDLIKEEKIFYKRLMSFDPPDPCDRDFIERTDMEWKNACDKFIKAKKELDKAEALETEARNLLLSLSENQSCKGFGVKTCQFLKKGNIDYSKIPELKNVSLENYRKIGSMQWRVSVCD